MAQHLENVLMNAGTPVPGLPGKQMGVNTNPRIPAQRRIDPFRSSFHRHEGEL